MTRLIVDLAHLDIARQLFPTMTVSGTQPTDTTATNIAPASMAGEAVILWCHNAELVAEELCGSAAKVGIINGGKYPPSFGGNDIAAKHYARTTLQPYVRRAAPDPVQPMAAPAVEPVAAPAKPERKRKVKEAAVTDAPKTKRHVRERTEGTSWADFGLVLTDKGVPMTSLDNCVHVIEKHPDLQGRMWYDSFLQKILHTWGVDDAQEWSDYDDVRLALFLQRDIGIPRVGKGLAGDAVVAYARREVRNCAYDWLDSLRWDGVPRLRELAVKGFGTFSNDYTRAVCRNLILSCVKRVFSPGCKCDYMPVFEGSQGAGKSKALAILGGEWFAELHMDWNGKDFYDALQGKMLLEIGELHAFKQSDVDRIKGIVSCQSDRYRASYGRHTQDYPRQCVFVGTTNRDDWNRDDTGARRFWPIVCGIIDHAWLRENREQLFAEAVHAIRAGESYWEVPWDVASNEQDDRRHADTWEDKLRGYLVGKTETKLLDVLTDGLDIEPARQGLAEQQRAGRALKKLGWLKLNRRIAGVQQKIWISPLYTGDLLNQ